MNLFQQVISRIAGLDKEVEKRVEEEKRGWETVVIESWRGNNGSSAASNVTPGSSIQMAAVFACVQRISRDLASLPLLIYERQEQSKKRTDDHILYELLNVQPNPKMTAYEFRETMQSQLLLWGNAYAQIISDGSGQIQELWPLKPTGILQTQVRNGMKYYQYQNSLGMVKWLSEEEIWHQHGLGDDGERGYSPITLMKRAVGLGMAAEEFGEKFFENDAWPGLILEHPGKLGDIAYGRLKDDVNEEHQGSKKAHKPWILEEGMKMHELTIAPDHAQFLETRKFQVGEICRIFLVPPHKIMDLDRATFSNIEQQEIDYWTGSIRPWAVRWEKSIQTSLMLKSEQSRYFAEHKLEGMLRGDTAARYQAYAVGRQNGWLSANDIRALENMDPIDGGNIYLVPMNMVPASQAGATAAAGGSPGGNQRSQEEIDKGNITVVENRGSSLKEAQQRLYIARSFKDIYSKTDLRAVKREIQDVNKAIKKYIKEGEASSLADFIAWMDEYYVDFHAVLMEYWEAMFHALGEAINANAAAEIGGPIGLTPGLDECLKYHVDRSAMRHVNISKLELKETVQKSLPDLQTGNLEAIEALFEKWTTTRVDEFAKWEVIRTANLMAKATWFYAQIKGLEWIQLHENPFCKTLNGKIVDMGTSCRGTHFVTKDDEITVADRTQIVQAGRSKVLKPSWNVATPPLFLGCECMISPIKNP